MRLARTDGDLVAAVDSDSGADAEPDTPSVLVAPAGEVLDRLHSLARAGNLRAIRKEIPAISAMARNMWPLPNGSTALAAAYQSPAVLRLIEQCAEQGHAA